MVIRRPTFAKTGKSNESNEIRNGGNIAGFSSVSLVQTSVRSCSRSINQNGHDSHQQDPARGEAVPRPLKAGTKKGAGASSVAPGRSSCLSSPQQLFEQSRSPSFPGPQKMLLYLRRSPKHHPTHPYPAIAKSPPHPACRVPRESPNRYPAQRVRIRKRRGSQLALACKHVSFLAPTLLRSTG